MQCVELICIVFILDIYDFYNNIEVIKAVVYVCLVLVN